MYPRHRPRLGPAIAPAALFLLLSTSPSLAPEASAYSDVPPAGRTGAPGETTCASCHGALNDGVGTLLLGGAPSSYVPGQKYTLTVSLARAGKTRWGFEVTSLFTTGGAYAGTLAAPSNLTLFQTKTSKGYVSHTTTLGADGTYAATANGPVVWSFDWTAPAAGAGNVTFYLVGVAADNDLDAGPGDLVYSTTVSVTEGAATATASTTWGWIKATYR
ncbi:MAG TPA: choice-of-anchor V domain-containing protein [Candidatus Eisenbacteria bacterium]|nr:choice-of-anchor V domain-containing protein [Candidatus Eisenbacteria bacterium]